MELTHPIEQEIRRFLREHVANQSEVSTAIGRSSSWLHKFVNGSGNATIDDLVRVAAVLFGLNLPALTEREQTLLRRFRAIDPERQDDVLAVVEAVGKNSRRAMQPESAAPAGRAPPVAARTARGKRRGAEGT